jgi:hypothetical protein
LGPDEIGKRVVIRSGDFLGTLCGVLVGVSPHISLGNFTNVQFSMGRPVALRDDMETLLLD